MTAKVEAIAASGRQVRNLTDDQLDVMGAGLAFAGAQPCFLARKRALF